MRSISSKRNNSERRSFWGSKITRLASKYIAEYGSNEKDVEEIKRVVYEKIKLEIPNDHCLDIAKQQISMILKKGKWYAKY